MIIMKEWLDFFKIGTEDKSWDISKDSMIRIRIFSNFDPLLRGQNLPYVWVFKVFAMYKLTNYQSDLKFQW